MFAHDFIVNRKQKGGADMPDKNQKGKQKPKKQESPKDRVDKTPEAGSSPGKHKN